MAGLCAGFSTELQGFLKPILGYSGALLLAGLVSISLDFSKLVLHYFGSPFSCAFLLKIGTFFWIYYTVFLDCLAISVWSFILHILDCVVYCAGWLVLFCFAGTLNLHLNCFVAALHHFHSYIHSFIHLLVII